MYCGGYDIIIPGDWQESDFNRILKLILKIWPKMIFEIEKEIIEPELVDGNICECGANDWLPMIDSLAKVCKKCGETVIENLDGTFEKGSSIKEWIQDVYGQNKENNHQMLFSFFIFENEIAEYSWNSHGRTDEFADSMIYVIIDIGKDLTFILDKIDSKISLYLIEYVISELRNGKTN